MARQAATGGRNEAFYHARIAFLIASASQAIGKGDEVRMVAPALKRYTQDTISAKCGNAQASSPGPQHRHARRADRAQPDRRDASLSQPSAR